MRDGFVAKTAKLPFILVIRSATIWMLPLVVCLMDSPIRLFAVPYGTVFGGAERLSFRFEVSGTDEKLVRFQLAVACRVFLALHLILRGK
jgi:hypothetical protein